MMFLKNIFTKNLTNFIKPNNEIRITIKLKSFSCFLSNLIREMLEFLKLLIKYVIKE